jgi:integral membrane protein
VRDINKVWKFYRLMATLVGVLLVVLCLIGVPLKYMWWISEKLNFNPGPFIQGEPLQQLGEHITLYLGITHGYLYMIFLLSAFMLSRLAKWSMPFTLVTLLLGTVPILSFWAEKRASRDVRTRFIDAVSSTG